MDPLERDKRGSIPVATDNIKNAHPGHPVFASICRMPREIL